MLNGKIVIYGCANSAACYKVRDFLTRNCADYDWVELNTDEEARKLAGISGLTDPRLPLCVLSGGSSGRTSGWLAVKLVRQRRANRFEGHDLRYWRGILTTWA